MIKRALNKKNVWIIDTTLRDGEQAPGVVFSPGEKEEIAIRLNDIGVNEIEVGIPAMGTEEINNIKNIMKNNLSSRVTSWSRANYRDIELAAEAGTDSIHISFPTSKIQLDVMDKNNDWLYDSTMKMISFAKKYFNYVSLGAQDATRTDIKFLKQYIEYAYWCGAKRIRIADTVGVANPKSIYELISDLSEKFPGELEFHGHNDLGMATANSITALQAGADSISVTVNGIGERAGNAALEEVAVATNHIEDIVTDIDCTKLKSLSEVVSRASNKKIHENKPIVGDSIFIHESGIHCNGQLKSRTCYQPFIPEKIGLNKETFVIGKHSGASSIQYALQKKGILISTYNARKLLEFVREKSQQLKRSIFDTELEEIYYSKL